MKVIRLLQLTAKNRTRETRLYEKKNIAIGAEETRTSHTIGAHKDTGVHGALEINLIGAANLYGATSQNYVLA